MNATVVVNDPEGLPVTVRVSFEGPFEGLSYNEFTGAVTGNIVPTRTGPPTTGTIVVTADDGVNPAVTSRFNFTFQQGQTTVTPRPSRPRPVTPPPTPPVGPGEVTISDPGNYRFEQGETISAIGISANDPEGGTLTIRVTNLPSGLSYSNGQVTGTVSETAPARTYFARITATATDGRNAVRLFSIIIDEKEDETQPPPAVTVTVSSISNYTFEQGQTISPIGISASASDGSTPTVSVSGLPAGLRFNSAQNRIEGTVSTSAAAQAYGVTVTATSGSATDSTSFVITITELPPEPPEPEPPTPAARQNRNFYRVMTVETLTWSIIRIPGNFSNISISNRNAVSARVLSNGDMSIRALGTGSATVSADNGAAYSDSFGITVITEARGNLYGAGPHTISESNISGVSASQTLGNVVSDISLNGNALTVSFRSGVSTGDQGLLRIRRSSGGFTFPTVFYILTYSG